MAAEEAPPSSRANVKLSSCLGRSLRDVLGKGGRVAFEGRRRTAWTRNVTMIQAETNAHVWTGTCGLRIRWWQDALTQLAICTSLPLGPPS